MHILFVGAIDMIRSILVIFLSITRFLRVFHGSVANYNSIIERPAEGSEIFVEILLDAGEDLQLFKQLTILNKRFDIQIFAIE